MSVDLFTESLRYILAAISFGLFCGAVSYLVVTFWRLARPERPVDWEIDYPEYRHSKDAHVKVVP